MFSPGAPVADRSYRPPRVDSHVLGSEPIDIEPCLTELGIYLKKKDLMLDPRPLLRLIFSKLLGRSAGFVDAIVDHIPSPVRYQCSEWERGRCRRLPPLQRRIVIVVRLMYRLTVPEPRSSTPIQEI